MNLLLLLLESFRFKPTFSLSLSFSLSVNVDRFFPHTSLKVVGIFPSAAHLFCCCFNYAWLRFFKFIYTFDFDGLINLNSKYKNFYAKTHTHKSTNTRAHDLLQSKRYFALLLPNVNWSRDDEKRTSKTDNDWMLQQHCCQCNIETHTNPDWSP